MPAASIKIAGYELLRQLGAGGMSTVWLAMQESLQRKVAIKVMRRAHESSSDDVRQFEKRFLLEGRTMAKLPHRNIVAVYDIVSNEDVSYIAMEYLEGGTLAERMHTGLSLAEAVTVVVQIAGALDYAHSQGIIHRDLKPANIMFRDPMTPVLTDFGIARQQDQAATRLTQTGMLVGTPNYMSPEQISGGDIDGRSDLYSLGIMFYELLSGDTPFQGDSPIAVMMAHLTQPPPQLDVEFAHFQPVLDRMLAKNRDDRYATMHEFVAALKERVVGSDTLLTRLKIDPRLTSSEQLRQLGFSMSDPASRSWKNLDALSNSAKLPKPQDSGLRKSSGLSSPKPAAAPQPTRVPARPTKPPPSARRAARWPWAVVAAAAIALLAALGIWQWQSSSGLSQEERELVGFWLKDAQRLADARKLVSPPGDNAYEILQKVLQKDPENASAQTILDGIAAAQRQEAETSLAAGDFAGAIEKVDQGLFVRKDDAELAALKQRIESARDSAEQKKQIDQLLAGAESALRAQRPFGADGAYAQLLRARAVAPQDATLKQRLDRFIEQQLAPARQSLAAREPRRALESLNSLKGELGKEAAFVELLGQAESSLKQVDLARQVDALLARSSDQLKAGRLSEPAADNAYETLDALRQIAADDPSVRGLAAELASALVADGRKVLATSPQRALERAELALHVDPQRAEAKTLKNDVEQRLGQRQMEIARGLSQAKQALADQRFLPPAVDNARGALDAVLKIDAENAEAKKLLAELPRRIAEAAQARIDAGDAAAATALLKAARDAYPQDGAFTALSVKVDALVQAEQAKVNARIARERAALALATPTPASLRAAAKDIAALVAGTPADTDALALRTRLADALAGALRAAETPRAFDEIVALAKELEPLLSPEKTYVDLARGAAAMRQALVDAETARIAASQGELVLNAQPWAKVESVLDGNRSAVALPGDSSTPLALKVPAGNYVITFRHPRSNKPVTVIAKVEPQRRAIANAAFPTISAEDYFTRAGW